MRFSVRPFSLLMLGSALALAACDKPLDLDFRGALGGLDTADAARGASAKRPRPDARGIISYPNYQVAVAQRGDTLADVAARVGTDAGALAKYNGIAPTDKLNAGEIVALPRRVAEPSPATGSVTTGPIQPPGAQVDITALASGAIDKAGEQRIETTTLPAAQPAPAPKIARGIEPKKHKVQRGETAYTVARLYDVSPRALAEWNGLGPDFAIREGQFLLIPVPDTAAPKVETVAAPEPQAKTELPGQGSSTPVPPSSTKPLPKEKTKSVAEAQKDAKTQAPDLGKTQTRASTGGQLGYPVDGKIIREYSKGKNDGLDFTAAPGSAVVAAEAGTVAAVTTSTENVQFVVVKHAGNLATVYVGVSDVKVKSGDKVSRGQRIASVPGGKNASVQFQVAKGTNRVDPLPYLQ
ncbi:MAG: LysM peptidoglycan-binding domain-containing M23 family metallopeptidase [Paracoccaceae bacterium]